MANLVLDHRTSDSRNAHLEKEVTRFITELGAYRSLDRFVSKYGRLTTKATYLSQLVPYLRWLRTTKGVSTSLDELMAVNPRCVYESRATAIETKRRHTDWLDEYVNRYLVKRGASLLTRKVASTAVRRFHARNDSLLVGGFSVAEPQAERRPPKPLLVEDIRMVLNALPLLQRLPLVLIWQSGMEISKVLGLT